MLADGCPCCGAEIDLSLAHNRGLVINRSAYLRSQLISMNESYSRMALFSSKTLTLKEQQNRMVALHVLIVEYEAELAALKEFL